MNRGVQIFSATWYRLLLALPLATCASCGPTPSSAPIATAYTDGFEAVVFDLRNQEPTNVRSVLLKDAEAALSSGSQAFIPGDSKVVEAQLATGKTGDSFVNLTVRQLNDKKQRIRLEFHGSNRAYVYEYDVEGAHLIPISSEYRDLARSKAVRYSDD